MDDIQVIASLVESLGLFGFMLISLRYMDGLRLTERERGDRREEDIIDDWKRMRRLDDTEHD